MAERGSTGEEGSSDEVEVLCSLQVHNARPQRSTEEDDLALAKALQDQERAFLRLDNYDPAEFGENFNLGDMEGQDLADADMAFARRLQAEEMQQQYSRLLDIAGSRHGAAGRQYDAPADAGDEVQAQSDSEEDEDDGAMGAYDGELLSEDEVDPDDMTYEELQALADTVGTVPRGVTPEVIAALPRHPYQPPQRTPRLRGAAAAEERCTVCCCDFEPGEEVKRLPCSHLYHPACIDQWLALNKACPICGREVGAPLVAILDTALRSHNH